MSPEPSSLPAVALRPLAARAHRAGAPPALVLLLDLAAAARHARTHLGGVGAGRHRGRAAGRGDALMAGTEPRASATWSCSTASRSSSTWSSATRPALVVLLSMDYLGRTGGESGEYYSLVLFATAGMMLMASAGDLIVVFLASRSCRSSLYVLAGLFRRGSTSGEASMKYFLLGAFASAFLLYGIALIYGATGSTNLDRIAAPSAARPSARPAAAGRARPAAGRLRVQDLLGARSTCGRPTSTRARRPRSPRSSPPAPRRPPSPRSSACCWWRCAARQADWTVLLWGMAALTHDARQRGGARPVEPQAHARVLVDRPRGLHAGGPGGGRRRRAPAPCSSTCSPTRSRRRARSASIAAPASAAGEEAVEVARLRRAAPRAIRCWRRRWRSSCSRWSASRRWPASSASSTSSAPRCGPATSGWP